MPTVQEKSAESEEEKKEDKKQIKFSSDDMKNAVVEFKGTDSAIEADLEVETFKKENIKQSSFCDGLIMKDMSSSIKSSCIGRKVKIGRNVQIVNSVIMNRVTIGD